MQITREDKSKLDTLFGKGNSKLLLQLLVWAALAGEEVTAAFRLDETTGEDRERWIVSTKSRVLLADVSRKTEQILSNPVGRAMSSPLGDMVQLNPDDGSSVRSLPRQNIGVEVRRPQVVAVLRNDESSEKATDFVLNGLDYVITTPGADPITIATRGNHDDAAVASLLAALLSPA